MEQPISSEQQFVRIARPGQNQRKFPWILVLVVAILLGGAITTGGLYFLLSGNETPTVVKWALVSGQVSSSEKAALEKAIEGLPRGSLPSRITIKTLERSDSLVQLSAFESVPHGTGGILLYAQKEQESWRIITPDDPRFCDTLREAPEELVGSDRFAFFRSCEE